MSEKETDILARTIYGEARGESISGMEAAVSYTHLTLPTNREV